VSVASIHGVGHGLDGADVVVCCGSGGVGKTTTAAALGLELARRGRRVVVVTIDPAKRLADALGVPGGLGNEPVQLAIDGVDALASGVPGATSGELWATMLDTTATFDGLVRAHAPTGEQAERILTNSFYRNIAGALSGTQEYMAAERLHALHRDRRFDVVIVDTPPTRNALDFLDAPGTLARFLDHPLFRLMMVPARRGLKVLNVAAQPVLRTIGKVVGGEVLADAIAFFQAFEGMEAGFRTRADEVTAVLRAPSTRYVLVASPKRDTVDEARYFAQRLHESTLAVGVVVVNRCTPTFGVPSVRRPARPNAVVGELWRNYDELRATADAELDQLAPLLAETGDAPVAWVPLLESDVHDLTALDRIRDLLFRPGVVGERPPTD
jgi:anion-transporting  ArsA/GET3 family ATPase